MASTKARDRLDRQAGMRLGPAGCGGDANSCYGDTSPDNAFASENDSVRTERRWIYVQGTELRLAWYFLVRLVKGKTNIIK